MKVLNKILTSLWKNSALIIGFVLAFVMFKACDSEKQVYKLPTTKVILKRIEKAEGDVYNHTTYANNNKDIVKAFNSRIAEVMDSLEMYKMLKDSVRIIQIQDTTIRLLFAQGEYKNNVIAHQDTVIVAQRYIINNQDTLITSLRFDLKKVKKQRNWSLLGNGILTGILIIK